MSKVNACIIAGDMCKWGMREASYLDLVQEAAKDCLADIQYVFAAQAGDLLWSEREQLSSADVFRQRGWLLWCLFGLFQEGRAQEEIVVVLIGSKVYGLLIEGDAGIILARPKVGFGVFVDDIGPDNTEVGGEYQGRDPDHQKGIKPSMAGLPKAGG